METTGNANGSNQNNSNISAINDDRRGRGGGGRYPGRGSHGGCGGGGRGGAGGRRPKDKLNKLSSSMSTFGESLAAQTHRLTEDNRNRQRESRGDNHNDTASETYPNRSLNCAGAAPGRNKQAHGDRK